MIKRTAKNVADDRKVLRCAIYTRKSTEEGLEQEFNSLDAQRASAIDYIRSQKHEGWECIETQYDDGGFTGANMERPGLRQLLKDIEAGRIDCVVVYKVDRLSRSLMDFSRIIEIFDRHKVAFVSVTQAFNTASSMGRLILNVLLSFAQFEREMISERTRDKIAAARRKGRWVGGVPILGYTVEDAKLIVDPFEAIRVREIFDLYVELKSTLQVAKELNQRGWRTKEWTTKKGTVVGGLPFNKNSVGTLLSNVTYTGKVEFSGEIYPGLHQAIVDVGTFDQVQAMLKDNNRNKGMRGRCHHDALLQGLLRCAACDCGMSHSYTKKGSRAYRYYVCHKAQKHGWDSCPSPSLPASQIEDFIVEQIRAIGQDPSVIRDTLAQTRIQTQTSVERIKKDKNALERGTLAHYERMNKMLGEGVPVEETVTIQEQIRENERLISELGEVLASLTSLMINESDVRDALGRFDEVWNALVPSERAKVINQIVDSIHYDGHTSELSINYHPIGIKMFSNEQQVKEGAVTC